ncbi:MAG: hypothetical protein IPM54_27465 [Polyangiaceae bacterium]|nr:hypothetical protein [Polyangiaceae bacterium]
MKSSRFPFFGHIPSTTQRLAACMFVLLGTACSDFGDSGVGDPPSKPAADPCGAGARLADVVGPSTWIKPNDDDSKSCAYPLDKPVSLAGLRIVAIDRYDETGDGATGNYYAQDACAAAGPYHGMTIYAPSFSPPDMRLFPGDVVDLLGNLMEFRGPTTGPFPYCRTLPEIGGTLTFRFELGPDLTAHTIPVSDLKTYESARQWLGMLVRVENVKIAGNPYDSSGRYSAPIDVGGGIPQSDVPSISNELFNLKELGPPLAQGVEFKSVTGIVTYFYGFKIAPRSADDFEI